MRVRATDHRRPACLACTYQGGRCGQKVNARRHPCAGTAAEAAVEEARTHAGPTWVTFVEGAALCSARLVTGAQNLGIASGKPFESPPCLRGCVAVLSAEALVDALRIAARAATSARGAPNPEALPFVLAVIAAVVIVALRACSASCVCVCSHPPSPLRRYPHPSPLCALRLFSARTGRGWWSSSLCSSHSSARGVCVCVSVWRDV